MNLIFITMDGARVDRILNGKYYQSLIKKSAFFSKVIAYAPYTIAAMHAVFSGEYGNKTGVNSYWSTYNFKKEKYKTLTSYLQDKGYFTFCDVINKLVIPKIGFDEFVIHDELKDDLTVRHKLLLERANDLQSSGKKFFLYLHYSNIHTGIMKQVLKKYNDFSKEYFDNREENEKRFDHLFENGDRYLEEIITHCEKLGLAENTLIVVISDHGISVGEKIGERAYGVFCYDYTLISTALFYHKNLPKIFVSNQVRSIDILPTILEILSIPHDSCYESISGMSMLPLINGKVESRDSFSQSGNPLTSKEPPKKPNVWAIRTEEWKFIKNIHDNSFELYYLTDDPEEKYNVVEKFPDKVKEFVQKMENLTRMDESLEIQ